MTASGKTRFYLRLLALLGDSLLTGKRLDSNAYPSFLSGQHDIRQLQFGLIQYVLSTHISFRKINCEALARQRQHGLVSLLGPAFQGRSNPVRIQLLLLYAGTAVASLK